MNNLADKLNEIVNNLKGKVNKTKDKESFETLKFGDKIKKGKRGGKREGSGAKKKIENLQIMGIKQLIDNFTNEEVEVQIMDREKGIVIKMKKPRIVALLEMMYQEAMKNKNIMAGKEVLDRALGKAPQTIKGDTDAPLAIIDVTGQLNKVYGSKSD